LAQVFQALLRSSVRYPLLVLIVAGGLAAVAVREAADLRIDTDFAGLLPEHYPSVQALRRLQETVGAESNVDVAIESNSLAASKAFAEALIPRAMALRRPSSGEPYFGGVDYRNDLRSLERYALYFASPSELDTLEALIRSQATQARLLADPLASDAIGTPAPVPSEADLRRSLATLGLREYPVSDDSTVLALRFYPLGSQTDIGFIDDLYRDLDSLIAAMAPASFAPDLRVTTAGRLLRQSLEVHAITDDVSRSFGAGVGTVLLVVVLYFLFKTVQARAPRKLDWRVLLAEIARTPVMALVLGIPLMVALCWAGGVAALAFGTLNLMTSTLGLVLFGLGIDYGIHFYARYAEERGKGQTVEDAAEVTFVSTGQAIAVSAITTAASLFVLTTADFRGFSEFGWIGGCGILFAMVSMLTVLPALLSLAERVRLLNLAVEAVLEKAAPTARRVPLARALVGTGLAMSLLALAFLPRERFEYDFSKLNPTYPEYEARAARVQPVFDTEGRLRNPAYLLTDRPEDVPEVVAALREEARRDTLILIVLSLQERYPTDSASIRQKLDRLAELSALLDDPFLRLDTTGAVDRLREALSITEPVPLDSVPEFLRRPFTTRSGEVGNFILVYAAASLSDGRLSMRFADLVGEVRLADGRVYYAASTSIVAADMLRLMLQEAPLMVLITALLVVAVIAFTFRSVRWSLLALTPLVVGLLWMLAVMEIVNVPLSFYNLVVLPAILGIGADSGVHIVHRYREEGPGSILHVLRSTGEHVAMGALTTLIGFAGQLLSFHPGLRSIGLLAVIGNTATMAAALVFLPALIQVLEDRGWLARAPHVRRDFAEAGGVPV
jgi:hypothetical protein